MGTYLSTPNIQKNTIVGHHQSISYAASDMQGWRTSMEDSKIIELSLGGDGMLFGVYDGHGGKEVAIFVSRHFCDVLLQNENYKKGSYELALQETYLNMDELLFSTESKIELARIVADLPEDEKEDNGEQEADLVGCTAVTALIKNNRIIVANAGDSRCILAKNGEAIAMSHDHKPDNEIEFNRITNAKGWVQGGRVMGNLNLSRCIGDLEYKKNDGLPPCGQMLTSFPDIAVYEITPDCDFLVLACDGIWDMLTNQNCVNLIYEGMRNNKTINVIAEEILDQCLAEEAGGPGCDNMTLIIVKLHE
ncbi:ARX1_1 [Blepharisma stoltei]|uniref:PPM-type phosphatase domain-containing protein n=1 Tax=Blepharisma stoltei TaxID=1481888 RepID=A0AAU9J994_9CILI|nr:unnamed protein product [Blepharisma stoltei]